MRTSRRRGAAAVGELGGNPLADDGGTATRIAATTHGRRDDIGAARCRTVDRARALDFRRPQGSTLLVTRRLHLEPLLRELDLALGDALLDFDVGGDIRSAEHYVVAGLVRPDVDDASGSDPDDGDESREPGEIAEEAVTVAVVDDGRGDRREALLVLIRRKRRELASGVVAGT